MEETALYFGHSLEKHPNIAKCYLPADVINESSKYQHSFLLSTLKFFILFFIIIIMLLSFYDTVQLHGPWISPTHSPNLTLPSLNSPTSLQRHSSS